MKKVLVGILAILTAFLIAGCAMLQKPEAVFKTVTVDGDLSDWGTYLKTDPDNDSKWGTKNEIFKAGVLIDANNLYIAGEFTKESYNNLMIIIDFDGVNGAADTTYHPWGRRYKFEKGDVDLVVETWGNGGAAWRFSGTTATEISSMTLKGIEDEDTGKKSVEISIPLSEFGITVTDAERLSLKAVFVLTGGFNEQANLQWAGDFYPEQPDLTEVDAPGGYKAPIVIKKVLENPKK